MESALKGTKMENSFLGHRVMPAPLAEVSIYQHDAKCFLRETKELLSFKQKTSVQLIQLLHLYDQSEYWVTAGHLFGFQLAVKS